MDIKLGGREMETVVYSNEEDDMCSLVIDGEEYVVLLPVEDDEEEDGEVVILKVEDTDSEDEESYVSVDDQEILNKVFEIFKEKFKDEFNFIDED